MDGGSLGVDRGGTLGVDRGGTLGVDGEGHLVWIEERDTWCG